MKTKLALTLEESIIQSAKKIARIQGISLSKVVENYLQSLASSSYHDKGISPVIGKWMGTLSISVKTNYKSELSKALQKKYKH